MSELATVLNSDVMKQALDLLLEEEVYSMTVIDGRMDALHQTALTGANREGFFRFYRNLKSLTKKPLTKITDVRPWQHTVRHD